MNWVKAHRQLLRSFAIVLLTIVTAARAAVPSGYMVDASADGGIVVRICGEIGEHRYLAFNPETGEQRELSPGEEREQPSDESSAGQVCAFAVASIAALTSSQNDAATPQTKRSIAHAYPTRENTNYASAVQALPARGPPFPA